MLVEVKIENFGIIEKMRIRLGSGLNVITGETGSGKSLILQAIDTVLGSRAGAGIVRNGSHRAMVEAMFEVSTQAEVHRWLEQNKFPYDDEYLVLQREIALDGKGRSTINGIPTRVGMLRSLSSMLIEIHGQHEHQRILDPDTHLDYLDLFAGTMELRERVAEAFHRYSSLRKRLRAVAMESGERDQRLDFLRFALDEIESFEPADGEFEEIQNEKALIQNSGRLYTDLCTAYGAIRDEEQSILSRVIFVESLLEKHSDILTSLEAQLGDLKESRYRLESMADFIRDEKDKLQFSPERLEDLGERYSSYQRLHRKYGGNTAAVLKSQQEYLRELSGIEMSDEESELLRSEIDALYVELRKASEELSRKRRSVISGLESQLKKELGELGMPGAEIKISVKRELDPAVQGSREETLAAEQPLPNKSKLSDNRNRYLINERGLDRVEFLLRANAGEAAFPLRKVASGGEMSRIMLALKSIIIDNRPLSSVIFDEVDTGVGGEVAHSIGGRLQSHALQSQVIVVTHLHQIAAIADQHLYVTKETRGGRTQTKLTKLNGDRRLHELARMLGGNAPGPVVLEHARELLSNNKKKAI